MITPEKAAEELKVIRQLMERPIRYSTMSGLSGIVAGSAALGGLAASYLAWTRLGWDAAIIANGVVWSSVFLIALLGAMLLTWRRERRLGRPFWTPVKWRVLQTIWPPFVAGMGATVGIVLYVWDHPSSDLWMLIAPLWMLTYALALWQVGQFSVPEVRLLGLAFLAAGLITVLVPAAMGQMPLAIGSTFGGLHIVYGIVIWLRYGG